MRATIRVVQRPSPRLVTPVSSSSFQRHVQGLRPAFPSVRTALNIPRSLGFGVISSRCLFSTMATEITAQEKNPPLESVATTESQKRRKRTYGTTSFDQTHTRGSYKRMKPNGNPEMEISGTIKALRQQARLSPRWISHVLLQCGKRSPDVRARTKQATEIFDSFSNLAATHKEGVPGIVYSALIGALVNNLARRPTDAPEVVKKVETYVERMKEAKHDMAIPTLTSLVRLYGLARRPEKAMEIVQDVEAKELPTDVQWYNTLIEMFYLNAAADKAKEVHQKLLTSQDAKANTITYNLMMKIAVQRNDYRDVIELFNSMKEHGIPPDEFSYLEAIRAAGRLSEPNTAQQLFDEMRASGAKPAIYVWTGLVDAYCRSNAIKRAFELAEEMRQAGVPPDTVIWRIIRDAAQRCGKGDMWARLKPSWVSNLHAASADRHHKQAKVKNAGAAGDRGNQRRVPKGDRQGGGDVERGAKDKRRRASQGRGGQARGN